MKNLLLLCRGKTGFCISFSRVVAVVDMAGEKKKRGKEEEEEIGQKGWLGVGEEVLSKKGRSNKKEGRE